MTIRVRFVLAFLFLICACSAPPPRSYTIGKVHDAIDGKRAQIVVDACVKYDTLSASDDYFLITESLDVARKMAESASAILQNPRIQLTKPPIILVCGAMHGETQELRRVAEHQGSAITSSTQPFRAEEGLNSSQSVSTELTKVSTYVQTIALRTVDDGKGKSIFSVGSGPSLSQDDFQGAARALKDKIAQDTVLYICVNGVIESDGKRQLKAASATLASLALAVTGARAQSRSTTVMTPSGQIVHPPGFGFYTVYGAVKGLQISQVAAALIDLKSGGLAWNNAMVDQMIRAPNSVDLLLSDVVNRRTSQ